MRVVASLTTLPKRLPYLHKTVDCILKQSYPLDMIYLCIPYKTRKGEEYNIPEDFYSNNNRVKIIRGLDYGPITKIYPTLFHEHDPNTLIITFDDDVKVHPDVVKILVDKHRVHPNACLSFSGWCVGEFPFYLQYASTNTKDVRVDWLQGVHAVLYQRRFLNEQSLLDYTIEGKKVPKSAFMNDDIWLSVHVLRNGAECKSINKRPLDYFTALSHRRLDSISGRGLNFEIGTEIINLCIYFTRLGIFRESFSAKHSVILYFLPAILILLTIVLLLQRYTSNWGLRLSILAVSILILYNIVFNTIAAG